MRVWIVILFVLCVGCGDFGGRGDTDVDCNLKEAWAENQCPDGMACNRDTGKCSTATCKENADCYCGERPGRGDAPVMNCTCETYATASGGRLGVCKRLYP